MSPLALLISFSTKSSPVSAWSHVALLSYKNSSVKNVHIRLLFDPPRCRVKLEEGVFEGVVQLHDGGLVAAPVAIVGGREDGDDVPVVRPVVALHHELVSSANQGQTIRMVECLRYVLKTEALDVTSAVQFVQKFCKVDLKLLV